MFSIEFNAKFLLRKMIDWGCSSGVEHLSTIGEILCSILNTREKKAKFQLKVSKNKDMNI
jgi:hypothetical protein